MSAYLLLINISSAIHLISFVISSVLGPKWLLINIFEIHLKRIQYSIHFLCLFRCTTSLKGHTQCTRLLFLLSLGEVVDRQSYTLTPNFREDDSQTRTYNTLLVQRAPTSHQDPTSIQKIRNNHKDCMSNKTYLFIFIISINSFPGIQH